MSNSDRFVTCDRCKGAGRVEMVIKPIHAKSEPDGDHIHTVVCPQVGCHNGICDTHAYYKAMGVTV